MVLCCSPSVGEKILNQWALNDKESENEDLQNDGNQLGNEDFEATRRPRFLGSKPETHPKDESRSPSSSREACFLVDA